MSGVGWQCGKSVSGARWQGGKGGRIVVAWLERWEHNEVAIWERWEGGEQRSWDGI